MAVKSGADAEPRECPILGVWVAMRVYAGFLDLIISSTVVSRCNYEHNARHSILHVCTRRTPSA